MALMNAEVYDAFKEAGASEDKARAAASSVATYDSQLAQMKNGMTEMTGEVRLLRWMVTFNLGLTVAVLSLLLRMMLV